MFVLNRFNESQMQQGRNYVRNCLILGTQKGEEEKNSKVTFKGDKFDVSLLSTKLP